jgi:biotin carboxyl carrier protein
VTFDVEIGGRRRRVELDRTESGWKATVDGHETAIDVVRTPSGWSMLADGLRSYDLSIEDRGDGQLIVHVAGHAIEARVIDPRAYRRRGSSHRAGHSGARQVVAPMPGRVVRILVENGERVSARQGLVVVEAMKMENELRAPGDAVVVEVLTSEGASVEAGTVLVVLG